MKVALVEFAGKGGLIHYAFQLARAMRTGGADVTLVTDRNYELRALGHPFTLAAELNLWDPKPADDTASSLVRRVRRAGRAAIWYREWARLAAILNRIKPDVVQFGDIRFATDLLPLAGIRRIAPVMSDICHNVHPFAGGEGSTGLFSASKREAALYRRIYRLFDAIFVHFDVNVAEFARTFPESAPAVTRIVHGNEEIFRELAARDYTADTLRRELGIGTARVILFFGTLSRYKGLDLLLESFARIAPWSDSALVVAGFPHSDFSVEKYRRRAAELGVGQRVHVVPRYIDASEVDAWMDFADVIAFPYRDVFQSGALHVAQTYGVPIVTTDVGAMAEVIRHGESGIVVEPNDERAFAGALLDLLTDRNLASRLGIRAARDAATKFSWNSIAAILLGRYEVLLRRPR